MITIRLKTLFFLSVIILINSTSLFSQFETGIISTLEAAYPDKNNIKLKKTFSYHIPQNSDFEALILIKSKTNKKFTFNSVSKTLKNINYSIIIPVPVEENTGVDSRTEQFLGQINPDVIRRAPFEVFEIIQPLTKNEIEILDIINPVINSKSVWREPSIKFMREYYISKGQIERSKEFSKMLD